MDFILGILTGIGIAIYAGHYLNNKAKKKQLELIHEREKMYWTAYWNGVFGHSIINPQYQTSTDLKEQLNAALEREDYTEAARIRDLMNKG